MKDYEVKTTVHVDRERVADLVCGALEGGSNYWCDKFEPDSYPEGCEWGHEAVGCGAGFRIYYEDFEECTRVPPGSEPIEKALQLMAEEFPRHFGDFMGETDDAETSDVFFQLLCFGEVVYG